MEYFYTGHLNGRTGLDLGSLSSLDCSPDQIISEYYSNTVLCQSIIITTELYNEDHDRCNRLETLIRLVIIFQ